MSSWTQIFKAVGFEWMLIKKYQLKKSEWCVSLQESLSILSKIVGSLDRQMNNFVKPPFYNEWTKFVFKILSYHPPSPFNHRWMV